MPKPSLSFTFLSMFTTIEKANEINGDLIEESHSRGRSWYYIHTIRTTISLFLRALSLRPVSTLLLSIAFFLLIQFVSFMLLSIIFKLLPLRSPFVVLTIILLLMDFLISFFGGVLLVYFAPASGNRLAIVSSVLFFVITFLNYQYSLPSTYNYISPIIFRGLVFGVFPLLLGAVLAHRKAILKSSIIYNEAV